MKLIHAACVIFAYTLIGTEAQIYATGVQIAATEFICSGAAGAQCASDCSTLMICAANVATPINKFVCPSPYQHCVNGACSTEPTTCTEAASLFTCTDEGFFPDPSDCTKYYLCDGLVPAHYQCPTGFVFNSKLNRCQKGKTPCTKINCSKATIGNPYIVYASNTQYYAHCVNVNGVVKTNMFRCLQNEIFDTTIGECQFKCAAKGYFQNPTNCNEYFYCKTASAKTYTTIYCPTGYVYDGIGCNSEETECQYPPPVATSTNASTPNEEATSTTTEETTSTTTEEATSTTTDETSTDFSIPTAPVYTDTTSSTEIPTPAK